MTSTINTSSTNDGLEILKSVQHHLCITEEFADEMKNYSGEKATWIYYETQRKAATAALWIVIGLIETLTDN